MNNNTTLDGTPMLPIPKNADTNQISINGEKPTLYPYRNRNGEILFYVAVIYANKPNGSSKKSIFPVCWWRYPDGREEWKFKQPLEMDRPLLNLPKILENPDKPIIIGEGEKTALALSKLFSDYVATTSSGGAQSATKTDWSVIRDRDVILSLDYDEAGETYGQNVYRLCKEAGAKSIRILPTELFGQYTIKNGQFVEFTKELPKGYDLADALDEGWTAKHVKMLEEILEKKGLSLFVDASERLLEENQKYEKVGKTTLKTLNLFEFLAMEIPSRGIILFPIIPKQGLVMLYAPRGIGKTYVALSIAYAVARGGTVFCNKWSAEKQCKVLFVDGEMPVSVLQERLAKIIAPSVETDQIVPENFNILPADYQENGIPDLATIEGQQLIEKHLEGVDLLILDNLSSLCRTGRENESESWLPMQEWLLSLRRRHISVLIVHHANKTGNQRGNSKKEDILDTVVSLRRGKTYDPQEGARFEVHYEKARGFYGEEAKPFEVLLREEEGKLCWQVIELEETELIQILSLHDEGLNQRQIAKELGIGLSTVNRRLKKAKEKGKIND